MASRIIGVMGKKRHGKDTFASRLISTHAFTRLAFADPMRDALYRLNPWVRIEADETGPLREAGMVHLEPGKAAIERLAYIVDFVGWEAAKGLREVRRLLQEYGTGLRETTHPDVWVEATMRKADAIPGPVVITDVRFPNEYDTIKAAGGTLVRVWRPGVVSSDTHISETALDGHFADVTAWNGSTREDLFRIADAVVHNRTR